MEGYVNQLFGLAGKVLDVKIAQESQSPLGEQGSTLGGDEAGRAYYRGQATGYLGGIPPAVMIGAGVLAAIALVVLLKR